MGTRRGGRGLAVAGVAGKKPVDHGVWYTANDSTSIEIAVGDDGVTWHLRSGEPGGIECGKLRRMGDGGCIFAQPNLIELPIGDFELPNQGYNFPHKYPRGQLKAASGLMKCRREGVVALEAEAKGEFATAIFHCPGKKLRVNALTKCGGSISIEIADGQGVPVAAHTFVTFYVNGIYVWAQRAYHLARWYKRHTTSSRV